MHVEHLNLASRDDIEAVEAQTRLFSDPPDGLRTAIAWEESTGQSAVVFVWDSAQASAQWSQEVMWPKLRSGELALQSGPPEQVEPVHFVVREQ